MGVWWDWHLALLKSVAQGSGNHLCRYGEGMQLTHETVRGELRSQSVQDGTYNNYSLLVSHLASFTFASVMHLVMLGGITCPHSYHTT